MTSSHAVPACAVASAPDDTMFSRVLLGIDFGAASLGAARWATTYVAPRAHAVLSHVVPLPNDVAGGDDTGHARPDWLHQTDHALEGGLRGFATTLALGSARSVLRAGRPSQWLDVIAREEHAELLVLGRRADANRVRVGEPNVTERTARRTTASVLVVPEGSARAPSHVLAAVDESSFALPVLRAARRLARLHEIPLTVMHVLSPAGGTYERVIQTARHFLRRGQKRSPPQPRSTPRAFPGRSTRWLARLGDPRTAVQERTEVALGDPAREITAMALSHGTPLVVVGARGADGAPAGSIGSVARELLTRAPVSVLMVNVAAGA